MLLTGFFTLWLWHGFDFEFHDLTSLQERYNGPPPPEWLGWLPVPLSAMLGGVAMLAWYGVGTARMSKGKADVPVRFSDAYRDRTVIYVMRREGGTWHLDDLRLGTGETLRGLLN